MKSTTHPQLLGLAFTAVLYLVPLPGLAQHAYLDDTDPVLPPAGLYPLTHSFPRTTTYQTQTNWPVEPNSKFDVVSTGGTKVSTAASLRAQYPDSVILRYFSGRATQPNGMPFNGTGPATANGNFYAGHWLYRAGTTTTQAISATATTSQEMGSCFTFYLDDER